VLAVKRDAIVVGGVVAVWQGRSSVDWWRSVEWRRDNNQQSDLLSVLTRSFAEGSDVARGDVSVTQMSRPLATLYESVRNAMQMFEQSIRGIRGLQQSFTVTNQ
jgi:hypothetical protein